MLHLFGNILTSYGTAANNRAENEGNITSLQKIIWKGEVHTTVSAEAIRWALRYYWQNSDYSVNREWKEDAQPESDHHWKDPNFNNIIYIDDDVLGFMRAEAAKTETSDESEDELQEETLDENKKTRKGKNKNKPKGTKTARRGALDVTRAVSMIPFAGDITFNSVSGKKGRTSLYGTEVHATRYQYGFALTPKRLTDSLNRTHAVLDGLISIGEVAGNHARFLYDFSPESIILRWTHDFSPRILYCFETDELGNISVPDLVRRIKSGDIDPNELWIGGAISESLEDLGTHVFPGVKAAVEALKQVIAPHLNLPTEESTN